MFCTGRAITPVPRFIAWFQAHAVTRINMPRMDQESGVAVFRKKLVCSVLLVFPFCAQAQVMPPDAGRIMESQRPLEMPKPQAAPENLFEIPDTTTRPVENQGATFVLKAVAFEGNTALDEGVLSKELFGLIGQSVGLGDLQAAANRLTACYARHGYLLAQAILPPQKVQDGIVTFRILEGFVEKGRVLQSSAVLSDANALAYTGPVTHDRPLHSKTLERQLLLLNDLPGVSARGVLEPGESVGAADIGLQLDGPQEIVNAALTLDNYGSKSTGEARLGGEASLRGLAGRADELAGKVMLTDKQEMANGSLSYRLPLGVSGLAGSAGIERLGYKLGDKFQSLEGHGEATDKWLRVEYPLLLARSSRLDISGEYRNRQLRDLLDAVNDKNHRHIEHFETSLTWSGTDAWAGWNMAQVTYTWGSLDMQDLAARQIQAVQTSHKYRSIFSIDPYDMNGAFSKTQFAVMRNQYLSDAFSLVLQSRGQVANKNLDSAESFGLGGPYAMRAYPTSEISGDTGAFGQVALAWRALPGMSVSVFSEWGRIKFHANELAGNTWTEQYLHDAGISLDWNLPGGWLLQSSTSWAGDQYDSKSEPRKTKPRVYGMLKKTF